MSDSSSECEQERTFADHFDSSGFTPRSMRLEIEALELAMQRGAADAKRLRRGRDVALRAQQGALQHAALDIAKMLRRGAAQEIACRHRLHRAIEGDAECGTGGARGADHEVVGVDREQSAGVALGRGRQHDPGIGERGAEQIRFYPPGRLACRKRDQIGERIGAVRRQEDTSSTPASFAS
jgi:hypothetical protein